jgi:hypothetical protein
MAIHLVLRTILEAAQVLSCPSTACTRATNRKKLTVEKAKHPNAAGNGAPASCKEEEGHVVKWGPVRPPPNARKSRSAWLEARHPSKTRARHSGFAQALSKETGLNPHEVGALAERFQQVIAIGVVLTESSEWRTRERARQRPELSVTVERWPYSAVQEQPRSLDLGRCGRESDAHG